MGAPEQGTILHRRASKLLAAYFLRGTDPDHATRSSRGSKSSLKPAENRPSQSPGKKQGEGGIRQPAAEKSVVFPQADEDSRRYGRAQLAPVGNGRKVRRLTSAAPPTPWLPASPYPPELLLRASFGNPAMECCKHLCTSDLRPITEPRDFYFCQRKLFSGQR